MAVLMLYLYLLYLLTHPCSSDSADSGRKKSKRAACDGIWQRLCLAEVWQQLRVAVFGTNLASVADKNAAIFILGAVNT
jgi:hypothetical protein